jgi:serine/threonine-protein kinase ATR
MTNQVGWVVGLGDRHSENILFDTKTGDCMHVDLACLFDKGKSLECAEVVPFRLTQNLIDGLPGMCGYEGIFRIACESTMTVMRQNKDLLMDVLEPFVHGKLSFSLTLLLLKLNTKPLSRSTAGMEATKATWAS